MVHYGKDQKGKARDNRSKMKSERRKIKSEKRKKKLVAILGFHSLAAEEQKVEIEYAQFFRFRNLEGRLYIQQTPRHCQSDKPDNPKAIDNDNFLTTFDHLAFYVLLGFKVTI